MYSLTDKKTIQYLCNKYDFKLKHGLGQNFLLDDDILAQVTKAAVETGEGIIEIGPGFGVLTAALASKAEKVVSIEIDEKLLPVLSETLTGFNNIEIIQGDALKTDFKSLINDKFGGNNVSVAANLPYYITTPIIMKLLEDRLPLTNIVFMVQKEVAERICADEGGKEYGAFTLAVKYFSKPSIICDVSRYSFTPPPNVESAVVKLEVLNEPSVKVINEKFFFNVIRASFSQRRKTLLNALKNGGLADKDKILAAFAEVCIDEKARGETLSIQKFAQLSNLLYCLLK